MWTYVKDRLPRFTRKQSQMLKGSYDFLGINYYSGRYAANKKIVDPWYLSYGNDSHVEMRGNCIKPQMSSRLIAKNYTLFLKIALPRMFLFFLL